MVNLVKFVYKNTCRKIRVDENDSIGTLKNKSSILFDLNNPPNAVHFYYFDNEHKKILVDSTEELKESLHERPLLLVLHLSVDNEALPAEDNADCEHVEAQTRSPWEVQCSICDANIVGTHYRCISCANFELCSRCLRYSSSIHPNHYFAQIIDSPSMYIPYPVNSVIETVAPAKEKALEVVNDTKSKIQSFLGSTFESGKQKINSIRQDQQVQGWVAEAQKGFNDAKSDIFSWVQNIKQNISPDAPTQNQIAATPIVKNEQNSQSSQQQSSFQEQEKQQI